MLAEVVDAVIGIDTHRDNHEIEIASCGIGSVAGHQLAAEGEGLRAGQLVFSGGVTAPVPVVAGGAVMVEFAGLGSIAVFGA